MNELAHFRFCGWVWICLWLFMAGNTVVELIDPIRRTRVDVADVGTLAVITTVVLWLLWGPA